MDGHRVGAGPIRPAAAGPGEAYAPMSTTRVTAAIAPGAVYTMTNAASGNSVLAFARAADGTLSPAGSLLTGGFGTGAGLGSQGSVALSPDGRFLLVVDPGSDQVSAFAVTSSGLQLLNTAGSGGRLPISVTACGGFAYVLHAGDTPGIAGFTLTATGLAPIAGSARTLGPSAAGPAEVQFGPACDTLVVTEKASNTIDTYTVGPGGMASGPFPHPSVGVEPFGSAFNGATRLVVTDAVTNAVTLYAVGPNGSLQALFGPVPDLQVAPCWLVVTPDGRFAYAANTGSGTISGFALETFRMTLLDANGVTAVVGGVPTDLALGGGGAFLYGLNGNGIAGFQVQPNGALKGVTFVAVPPTAQGLAAS